VVGESRPADTAIADNEHEDIQAAPQRRGGGSVMLLTITLILAAMIAVAALELWLFWRVGERDDRRRVRIRAEIDAAGGGAPRGYTIGGARHQATGAFARLRGRSTSTTRTQRGETHAAQ
jgi:hypothetical protein